MDNLLVRRYFALAVAVAGGVAVVQGLLILGVATLYRDQAARRVATVGLATAGVLVEQAVESGRPWPEIEQRLRAELADVVAEDELAVYDEGGRLLARTSGRRSEIPNELSAAARQQLDAGPQLFDEGRVLPISAGTVREIGGRRYYIVRVDDIWGAVMPQVLPLGIVALLVPTLLLGGSGAFLILRVTSRQLGKVDRVLRMMSSGDLSARLSLPVDPDTAGVVLSFNRMAEKVETTIEKLRRSDESRRQLLADVTHELNTPLTSVLGYLETLTMEDLPLPEERRAALTRIAYEEAVNLRALIEDLTTLSRLDAEGLSIERERVALSAVVERVARRLSQMAEKRGVALVTDVATGVEVQGDAQRLDQVVRNLVENALRHTAPPGDVTVVLRRDGAQAVIEVTDRGAGMPAEALARIGQRFLRLDKSRARDTGGRGLGLAITVGLVEVHGGRVEFESQLGSGTRVRVTLPLLAPRPAAADAPTGDSGDLMRPAGDVEVHDEAAPASGSGEDATATPGAGTPATTPAAAEEGGGSAPTHRSSPTR